MHGSKIACIITAPHGERHGKASMQTSRDLPLSHLQTDQGSHLLSYQGEKKILRKIRNKTNQNQNLFPCFSLLNETVDCQICLWSRRGGRMGFNNI